MTADREEVLRALLGVLAGHPGPVGTRAARAGLAEKGIDVSESSVSRRLRELDERGWSRSLGGKGRVLSPEGQRRQAELELSSRTSANLGLAVDVRDVQDLLDLLHARKAVESAAAADAAVHAGADDIRALEDLVAQHRSAIGTPDMAGQPGLMLHRRIAAIAPNRMLKTLTGLVLAPHLDRVESVLDIVLGSPEHLQHVVEEHRGIAAAIAAHDPRAAERAMDEHFDKMIDAGQNLIVGENASVVSRLLTWMDFTTA